MENLQTNRFRTCALTSAISLLVALVLAAPAFADTTVTSADGLQTAISAGGEVTLGADISTNITIPEGKTVTLNLGGYTLTNASAEDTITVEYGATLTIAGNGKVDNTSHGCAALWNNGTTTINGGTLTRSAEKGQVKTDSDGNPVLSSNSDGTYSYQYVSGGNSYYTVVNHGDMTIKEGTTVENSGSYSSMIENGYANYSSGSQSTGYVEGENAEAPTLTIAGGTFTGGKYNIKNDDAGIVNISGGTFSGGAEAALCNFNEATIDGGTFTTDGVAVIQNNRLDSTDDGVDQGEVTINGGTFTASSNDFSELGMETSIFGVGVGQNVKDTTINITGGTFNGSMPSDKALSATSFNVTGGEFSVEPTASNFTFPEDQEMVQQADGSYKLMSAYRFTSNLTMSSWTYGEKASEPKVSVTDGTDVTYKYYDSNKQELSEAPSLPGTYYVQGFASKKGSTDVTDTTDMVKFTIANATVSMSGWTYGEKASTPSLSTSAKVTYTYYDSNKKELSAAPTLPGTYYVAATASGTVVSNMAKFKIYKPAVIAKTKLKGKKAEKVSWTKVKGATGYEVYFSKCGKKMKKIKTVKGTSFTKKGLKKGKSYRFYIKAFTKVNGKKVYLAKSRQVHCIAGGFNKKQTNVKTIKVKKASVTLSVGKTSKIKVKTTKVKKGKKYLVHSKKLVGYKSDDVTVATVSASGKITAKKAGTCKVYVMASTGKWTAVKVTVK